MIMVRRDVKFDEEKAMQLSLERAQELLAPKEEPEDVEQPQA